MVFDNCASIPDHLFESPFWGHRKGAFTGADLKFSLTDYVIVSLYLILALSTELLSRVASGCYSAYRKAKSRREEMMPLIMK